MPQGDVESMFASRVTSQAFLKADLENILRGIVRARRPRQHRVQDADAEAYWEGFTDAIECVAAALDIPAEDVIRGGLRGLW